MLMIKMVVVLHQPPFHVILVLVLTWSRNFSSHDKVSPLGEIDWAQYLALFARTSLPLVVGMAEARSC